MGIREVPKTITQMAEERDNLENEARELITRARANGEDDLTGEDADRFDEIAERLETVREAHRKATRRIEEIRALGSDSRYIEAGTPGEVNRGMVDASQPRNSVRDTARREIERSEKLGYLSDTDAEHVETLTRSSDKVSRLVTATGSDAYRSAFVKMLSGDPSTAMLRMTSEEQQAYRAVEEVRAALTISDAGTDASVMIPYTVDPTIILTNAGVAGSLRGVARVVQTLGNKWRGVSSAGVTASWDAELEEVSDDTPSVSGLEVDVHKAQAFASYSIEMEQDAPQLLNQLRTVLADGKARLEEVAFFTGSGTGEPEGLNTGLGAPQTINSTGTEAITEADVYALLQALPPRYQANASWVAGLNTLNSLRRMVANGVYTFPGMQSAAPTLLGRSVAEVSTAPVVDANATATVHPLFTGDFKTGFVIADRVGMTLELVPHLFGTNRRPNGSRGLYMHWRVGSAVVVPDAIRRLAVQTTA